MVEIKISLSGAISFSKINEKERRIASHEAALNVRDLVASHFRKLGGRKYWYEAAKHTRVVKNTEGTEIHVQHAGVALRRYGGVVLPGQNQSTHSGNNTKLLSIPANEATRYKRPFESGLLSFMPIKGKRHLKGLLMEAEEKTATQKYKDKPAGRVMVVPKKDGRIMFTLVDRTEHKPDPSVLPTTEEMTHTAKESIISYLESVLKK